MGKSPKKRDSKKTKRSASPKKEKTPMREGQAYCVKCKAPVTIKGGKVEQTARGTNMIKGHCSVCNTKVCRIISKAMAAKL